MDKKEYRDIRKDVWNWHVEVPADAGERWMEFFYANRNSN